MYIVITHDDITVPFYDFDDVKTFLFGECAKWVHDPNYIGDGIDTAEELFDCCMSDHDFGGIAEVYKLEERYL